MSLNRYIEQSRLAKDYWEAMELDLNEAVVPSPSVTSFVPEFLRPQLQPILHFIHTVNVILGCDIFHSAPCSLGPCAALDCGRSLNHRVVRRYTRINLCLGCYLRFIRSLHMSNQLDSLKNFLQEPDPLFIS